MDEMDDLRAKRNDIYREIGPYRVSFFGGNAMWPHQRKAQLETVRAKHRAKAAADGVKITESALDEAAHTDSDYLAFLGDAELKAIRHQELEGLLWDIEERIEWMKELERTKRAELRNL